jgi:Tfp pilus assembly protein PilF
MLYWRSGQLPAAERALREGNFAEARARLSRCLSWSPDDPEVLCLAARLERVEGNYDAAAAFLEQCQARTGATPLLALESSLLRAQRGDLSEERTLLQLADGDNPQTPWILEALTQAHLRAFHFALVMRLTERWLKLQPDCARALEYRGRAMEHLRVITQAVETYERALDLEPGRWQVRLRLVSLLLDNSRVGEASPHLAVLEREHPDDPDVLVLLGQRDVFQNRLDQAGEHFGAALRADPKHFRAMLQLGKLELQRDRPKEAEHWLARAHQAFPFNMHIHFALSECYVRLGDPAKASFHLSRHDEIKMHSRKIDSLLAEKYPAAPNNPQLLTELGVHFFGVGQNHLGEQFLQNALRVDGNYVLAHAALADHYEQIGETGLAATHRAHAGPKAPPGKAPARAP